MYDDDPTDAALEHFNLRTDAWLKKVQ